MRYIGTCQVTVPEDFDPKAPEPGQSLNHAHLFVLWETAATGPNRLNDAEFTIVQKGR